MLSHKQNLSRANFHGADLGAAHLHGANLETGDVR
ncbi:pentapeptide repeat-containing protein [Actinophytocola oryzae]